MTPRERVLAALGREEVDQIPWIEGIVQNGIASAVCGQTIDVDWSVAPDGFPTMPGDALAEEQKKVNRVLGKANLQFSAFAPIFCHKMTAAHDGSPVLVGDGKIKTRQDFEEIFMKDLVEKEPHQIQEQVRNRIQTIGRGGGYIISSSNSLTDDMKPENILAMADAIREYG